MQKIKFQNLPSTTTPVNATNLNAIQTNVETALNGKTDREYLGNNPNINNLKTSGSYGIYNCSQAPTTNIGTLEVIQYTADWILQRFTDLSKHQIYERTFYGGTTWSSWRRIYNATILYDNDTGSDTSVSLSDNLENYEYIEIFFEAEGVWNSIKTYNPKDKTVSLIINTLFNNDNYFKNTKWYCSNSSIYWTYGNAYAITASGVIDFRGTQKPIKIHRVVGYK